MNQIPSVLSIIVSEGLTLKAFNASVLAQTMALGIRRSMFSNEAGLGTLPSISAMADSKNQLIKVIIKCLVSLLTRFYFVL